VQTVNESTLQVDSGLVREARMKPARRRPLLLPQLRLWCRLVVNSDPHLASRCSQRFSYTELVLDSNTSLTI
jgi:hypothetical protein